jgi:hypothetical protein
MGYQSQILVNAVFQTMCFDLRLSVIGQAVNWESRASAAALYCPEPLRPIHRAGDADFEVAA